MKVNTDGWGSENRSVPKNFRKFVSRQKATNVDSTDKYVSAHEYLHETYN